MRLETISAANAAISTDRQKRAGRFWLSTTRAAYQRDVLLTQTSATMSAMTTRPMRRAPPRKLRASRCVPARDPARAPEIFQNVVRSTPGFGEPAYQRLVARPRARLRPRRRVFADSPPTSPASASPLSLCHIAGERALHACARRAPPRVATDPIPRRSPGRSSAPSAWRPATTRAWT